MTQKCILFLLIYFIRLHSNLHTLQEIPSNNALIGKYVLHNGLRVVVLSDPSCEEASVALSVQAGTWDDPEAFQGMAHFVEHLLFLGTKAHPREDEFLEFVQQRGGRCNALTTKDRTTYGFSIRSFGLQEALNRFSHFFIDPLFSSESIHKEIHSLQHEFEDTRENDSMRIWRVFKEMANPYHPNRKFSIGNILSLSRIQKTDIESWFEHHYTPSRMCLVVTSHLPVDTVLGWIQSFFSNIPKRDNKESFSWPEQISSSWQKGTLFHIPPVLHKTSLSILWEIPEAFLSHKALQGIHLVEKEIGGDYSELMTSLEGLSTSVKAEVWHMGTKQVLFGIHLTLTQEGVQNYTTVVEKCFSYLSSLYHQKHTIAKTSITKWAQYRWKRTKDVKDIMEIAKELLVEDSWKEYPTTEEIDSSEITQYMEQFLAHLTPADGIYFLIAPLKLYGIVPSHMEKWIGVEYYARKIPTPCIDRWSQVSSRSLIQTPTRDTDQPLPEEALSETEIAKEPVFLVNQPGTKIRLVESNKSLGQLEFFLFIDTPKVGRSIKNWALSEVFVRCMNQAWLPPSGEEAKGKCELQMNMGKLCLVCSMGKEQVKQHLPSIFFSLKNTPITQKKFDEAKKDLLDYYEGDPDPLEYAHKVLDSLTTHFYTTETQLYHILTAISYEDFLQWKSKIFSHASLEGAFLGSISLTEAQGLWKELEENFSFTPYYSTQITPPKSPYLEDKIGHYWIQKTHRLGNALLFLISSKGQHAKTKVVQQIIGMLLQTEFFTHLRTEQQTSYRLHTWSRILNNTFCYGFSIQSSTHPSLDLLQRTEQFLDSLSKNAHNIFTKEKFSILQHSVISYWDTIKKQSTKEQDRLLAEKNSAKAENISYEEILETLQSTFSLNNRRRMAILIEGRDFFPIDPEELSSMGYGPIYKEQDFTL